MATDITNLTASVGTNAASISTEATARADADTANALAITNLTSTVGDANASITSLQTVTTNLSNDASAAYVLQVNANGSVAGMVIEANASGAGDNSGSAIQFVSDKFAIWNGTNGTAPFIVDSGIVYIKEALIEDGSITNAKIGTLSADKITTGGMSAARITAGTISTDRLDASVIVATDLSTNTSTVIHGGNITTNTISATSIVTDSITGDQINTNLLNVKSFDNVSSTIVSHLTAGTKFPLARDGQTYIQRSGTYTGSNASFVPVTITQVRNNAGYVAIFSGVLGNVSGGRVQYSLNNSTWVNASGNTNISWSAGTYRGYNYVYTGQITTLSTSQSIVYWRVYFSGAYNHTQLSLNVMMDNTR